MRCKSFSLRFQAGSNPTLWQSLVVLAEDADTGHEQRHRSQRSCRIVLTTTVHPAVSFLCPSQLDAVRFRQLFQRFSETVHAGFLIVKLL